MEISGRTPENNLTTIILKFSQGDSKAENQLILFAYQRFKDIARNVKYRSSKVNTEDDLKLIAANTTSLVHEAFIKLKNSQLTSFESRKRFYDFFANVIYTIFMDEIRKSKANKRNLIDKSEADEVKILSEQNIQRLIDIEKVLEELKSSHSRQVISFIQKYICGSSIKEISQIQMVSESTVDKDIKLIKTIILSKTSEKEI